MLELVSVKKSVGDQVHIHPTDLVLLRGTMNVLLGPTQSGKTTLMRIMAGLEKLTSGSILWNGEDVTNSKVQDRDVAMVYQQFVNYPSMNVYDNIASPLRLLKQSKQEIDAAVVSAASLMKLSPFLSRNPLELSGGQQQRCALARALVKNSGLVLLDEPLANLDYKLREELRVEIPKIFEESGSIFVYATTDPEEALLLGGNTSTIWDGAVTQFGPTAEVYRQPADVRAARVFSDPPMNFAPCKKNGKNLTLGAGIALPEIGAFSDLADGEYLAGFRANQLGLEPRSAQDVVFSCVLNSTEITGAETYLHASYESENWVSLMRGVHDREVGEELSLWLDPSKIFLFDGQGKLAASTTNDKSN